MTTIIMRLKKPLDASKSKRFRNPESVPLSEFTRYTRLSKEGLDEEGLHSSISTLRQLKDMAYKTYGREALGLEVHCQLFKGDRGIGKSLRFILNDADIASFNMQNSMRS
jgi:hypothetical protein